MEKTIKKQKKEIALKISNKLENKMAVMGIKSKQLADFIGVSPEYFSKQKVELKRGKLPSPIILIGIQTFFQEIFFI